MFFFALYNSPVQDAIHKARELHIALGNHALRAQPTD